VLSSTSHAPAAAHIAAASATSDCCSSTPA
jgi:hypothetical protein